MARRRRLLVSLVLLSLAAAGCSGSATKPRPPASATTPASASTSASPAAVSSSPSATPKPKPKPKPRTTPRASPTSAKPTPTKPAAPASRQLPLDYSTGDAGQVITVTAASGSSTTATLQAWSRVSGGWHTVGPSVSAYLGSAGIGQASEGSTKTPAGSYTLTQAFGHDSNPGTSLPYRQTTSSDWWISQSGPLYNTHQQCSSGCSFSRGDPNEHLYYETPYYNYAVVIDYNTRNSPGGVKAGAGSAFFLHVAVGAPTAGCVSIPQDQLVRLMRWLNPSQRPRILMGVG